MSVVNPLPLESKCVTRAENSVLNSIIQKIRKQIRASRRELEKQENLDNLSWEEKMMLFFFLNRDMVIIRT